MKTKQISVLGILMMLYTLLAGGCAQQITAGKIVEKKYEAARTYNTNKNVFDPVTRRHQIRGVSCFDDEDYILIVQNEKGETGTLYLEKEDWESKKVGETFDPSATDYTTTDTDIDTVMKSP